MRSSTWRLKDFWPYFSEKISSSTLTCFGVVLLQVAEQDEQQREAGEPLLAVDDVADALLLADDDRAEEIVRIVSDLAARVCWAGTPQETCR